MISPFMYGGIMLPNVSIDLNKFATVACDQFTSDISYWEKLGETVGSSPSALRITYPEIFLNDEPEKRIAAISKAMREYLNDGVFEEIYAPAVVVDRSTPYTKSRLGLVAAIDLDAYTTDGESIIRATEAVVKDRVPPRVEIRKGCPLELPHIMLLCEDKDGLLVETAYESRGKKLYDFELNMNGGHIKGYEVEDISTVERAVQKLTSLSEQKYGKPFLFAVGDGNHSLAAAKKLHEEMPNERNKYALVEIVNVCGNGVTFHPIHRLAQVKNPTDFIKYMQSKTRSLPRKATLLHDNIEYVYNLPPDAVDGVELVQRLIDEFGCESIDYIHGDEQLKMLSVKDKIGVKLYAPAKDELFATVAKRGRLPKKTFSIGEGEEKRYYLEARRIV